MSRDFNNANFSSARQGLLEDRKTFEPLQEFVASHLCMPIYAEWMDMCVTAGLLKIRDYWQNRDKYLKVQWMSPGMNWIDPEKEVKADILAIQNGGKTMAQWCSERGYDWREQLAQMALEKKTAEDMGLILSIHTPVSVQAAMSNHTDDSQQGEKEETNNAEDKE